MSLLAEPFPEAPRPPRDERVAEAAHAVTQAPVEASGVTRDGHAIVEARVGVGPALALRVPGGPESRRIVLEERPADQRHQRLLEVEAAEMEECDGDAVDPELAVLRFDLPVGQPPVTDVVPGVAQDVHRVEEPGHEVEPPLVREKAEPRVGDALVVEPSAPPVEEA